MRPDAPHERFGGLTYDAFQTMAGDDSLSEHERTGFPDDYREGAEAAIVADILGKLPRLSGEGATVVDIGCGAGPLTGAIVDLTGARHHRLLAIDGPAVLARVPDAPHVMMLAGRFPDLAGLDDWRASCDAVIAYSVLQYAFHDASVFAFLDAVLALLAPGGRALLGDLPNLSMRRRFLASDAGRAHHRAYVGEDSEPDLDWPAIPTAEPDDGALLGLLARARGAGFHAWLVPQAAGLPMANRREDLLIERP